MGRENIIPMCFCWLRPVWWRSYRPAHQESRKKNSAEQVKRINIRSDVDLWEWRYLPWMQPIITPTLNTSPTKYHPFNRTPTRILGRDILGLHKVHEQVSGPDNAQFAQRLDHHRWCMLMKHQLQNIHPREWLCKPSTVAQQQNRSEAPRHQHNLAPTSTWSSTMLVEESLGQTIFTDDDDDHRWRQSSTRTAPTAGLDLYLFGCWDKVCSTIGNTWPPCGAHSKTDRRSPTS